MTLLVSDRYTVMGPSTVPTLSTLLMAVSVVVLIVQMVLDARRARAERR